MQRKGNHVPAGFCDFWEAYGLKRDRCSAEPVWKRMSQKDRRAAMAGIASYRETCRREGVAMVYPAKYLVHRRWEDEPSAVSESCNAGMPDAPAGDVLADMESW